VTKAELQAKRSELIAQLEATTDARIRMCVQAELSATNAEIKAANIRAAAGSKLDADVKRALGKEEEKANLRRARERDGLFKAAERAPHSGLLTRGEHILRTAKQLLKTIERINPASKLPHTLSIEVPLRDFIAAQKAHVHEYRAQTAAALRTEVDEDWQRTWTAEGSDKQS
jgi:hypothetical protein